MVTKCKGCGKAHSGDGNWVGDEPSGIWATPYGLPDVCQDCHTDWGVEYGDYWKLPGHHEDCHDIVAGCIEKQVPLDKIYAQLEQMACIKTLEAMP